jgi:hypothetical protein
MEGRQMVMLLAPKKTLPKQSHPTNKPEAGSKASPSESTAVGSK